MELKMNNASNKALADNIIKVFLLTQGTCILMMMGMVWYLSNANMAEIGRSITNYGEKTIAANALESQRSTDMLSQQQVKTEILVNKLHKEIEALKISISSNKIGLENLQDIEDKR